MRYKITILLFFLFQICQAQVTEKIIESIDFHGFVNWQAFYDTRQNVESREGMFTFYPSKVFVDSNGVDVNAKDNLNLLAMTTRLGVDIKGTDILGAKVNALIETDFTGVSNFDNNGLRLRHAFIDLHWTTRELLTGHYWHPMYVAESPVNSIALNSGAPFHSFSRMNQIRFTQKFKSFRFIFVAGSQLDYANEGPSGRTPLYLRNAVIPNLHFQMHFKNTNHLLGFGLDYKILKPVLITVNNYVSKSKIPSIATIAFSKSRFGNYELKLQMIWGQNLSDHLMLGGFAVHSLDTVTGENVYTTFDQASAWMVFEKVTGKFKPGVFVGYLKNLGSPLEVKGNVYGRGSDIGYVYRLAPRLTYWENKAMFALEIEYTVAGYGSTDDYMKVQDIKEIANLRILTGVFYFF